MVLKLMKSPQDEREWQLKSVIQNRKDLAKRILRQVSNARATILYGPPGIGKTLLCEAIYDFLGYSVTKLDASSIISPGKLFSSGVNANGEVIAYLIDGMDSCKKDNYDNIVKLQMKRVFEKKKGRKYLVNVITRSPILMTCNNIKKFKLKDAFCDRMEVKPLPVYKIERILERYSDDERVLAISNSCKGDIRKGMNMIDSIDAAEYKPRVEKLDLSSLTREILASDEVETYKLLNDQKVGDYGGYPFEYLVSLLGRNVKGVSKGSIRDVNVLLQASKVKYLVDKRIVRLLISQLSFNKIKYVKFPRKKKKEKK
jgi:DNA polymerase III delta prime subunit